DLVRLPFRLTLNRVDQRLVDVVLRLVDQFPAAAVFPAGRAQIAERDLSLAVVELRDLAELQRVALAGAAGEIVENSPARGHGCGIAAGLGEPAAVHPPAAPDPH